jgi:hypothetical protein
MHIEKSPVTAEEEAKPEKTASDKPHVIKHPSIDVLL